jgi:hypothetical protein
MEEELAASSLDWYAASAHGQVGTANRAAAGTRQRRAASFPAGRALLLTQARVSACRADREHLTTPRSRVSRLVTARPRPTRRSL